jgi:predicted esterase
MRRTLFFACLVAFAPSFSCSSSSVRSIWTVPASLDALDAEHFLDFPFPSDYRRDPDGSIRFSGLYNPQANETVKDYIEATKGLLDGASTVAASYFRFTGAIDPMTLPQSPPDSTRSDSAVQLIDVDPASPARGTRHLLQTYFRASPPAEGSYWLPDTLVAMPAQGYPLRPHNRYALVVTKRLRAPGGAAILPSEDLERVLGLAPLTDATKKMHDDLAPLVRELDGWGVPADYIVSLTWFTTNDPTSDLFRVVDWTKQHFDAPVIDPISWQRKEVSPDGYVYEAVYGPVPNFQAGKLPFVEFGDGGGFVFDAAGNPIVQSTFTMRTTIVVPRPEKCPMPKDGYPMVLYAHGTGGDYRSIVSESRPLGFILGAQCLASMGVDQIFHGTRPGAPPLDDPNRVGQIETLFFNFANPIAARTNGRQAAVDVTQQARLFTVTHQTIPSWVSQTGEEIRFDASKILFVGHSQGGVNGPMFLAADDAARGGVLSGTGADIRVALIEKTKPSPSVASAVRLLLGLSKPDYDDELNFFHPMLNLAQTLIDPTDPYLYMGRIIKNPRPGFAPKSIYQTEGVTEDGDGDHYTPPDGIEIASVALGLPRELPGVRPIPNAAWSGIADVTVPPEGLRGNLANGRATGLLGQFPPIEGSDGHFVLFDVPQARKQAAVFCKNLAADPIGLIPPLQ